MAFRKFKETKQISLADPVAVLNPEMYELLKNSWSEQFAQWVFPAINEERFSVLYSENDASRPNVPVKIIIALLILKELFGETDEELINHLRFGFDYRNALRCDMMQGTPVSVRTLLRFRERVYEYYNTEGKDLIHEAITEMADIFKEHLNFSPKARRVDSIMVSSGCRDMSRIQIVFMTIRKMVTYLLKIGRNDIVGQGFEQYQKSNEHEDIAYNLGKDEIAEKLSRFIKDADKLAKLCESEYSDTNEYKLLKRMIEDQSVSIGDEVKPKDSKDIKPTSLQNPSDEDAQYRKKSGKSHKGYVANVVEDCGEAAVVDEDGNTAGQIKVNIISDYDVQKNSHSDQQFAKDVLASTALAEDIDVLIADGGYSSSEVIKEAAENGINLVLTGMSGGVPDAFESGFDIDEETRKIKQCPNGCAPKDSAYDAEKEQYSAHFDKPDCENCPFCERCRGTFNKSSAKIFFSEAARIKAEYALQMNTEVFKKFADLRNGVEGVMSVLRRRYNIGRWQIKGLVRSKFWFGLKIGAINVTRMLKAM